MQLCHVARGYSAAPHRVPLQQHEVAPGAGASSAAGSRGADQGEEPVVVSAAEQAARISLRPRRSPHEHSLIVISKEMNSSNCPAAFRRAAVASPGQALRCPQCSLTVLPASACAASPFLYFLTRVAKPRAHHRSSWLICVRIAVTDDPMSNCFSFASQLWY